MEPGRHPAREAPLNVEHRVCERVVCPDQLHLEWVKPRISKLPGDPKDFPIGHVEIIVGDLIRHDIKARVDFFGFLEPKGSLDGKIFLELAEKLRSGLDLFNYQWDLIHCITPFELSVIAE